MMSNSIANVMLCVWLKSDHSRASWEAVRALIICVHSSSRWVIDACHWWCLLHLLWVWSQTSPVISWNHSSAFPVNKCWIWSQRWDQIHTLLSALWLAIPFVFRLLRNTKHALSALRTSVSVTWQPSCCLDTTCLSLFPQDQTAASREEWCARVTPATHVKKHGRKHTQTAIRDDILSAHATVNETYTPTFTIQNISLLIVELSIKVWPVNNF